MQGACAYAQKGETAGGLRPPHFPNRRTRICTHAQVDVIRIVRAAVEHGGIQAAVFCRKQYVRPHLIDENSPAGSDFAYTNY